MVTSQDGRWWARQAQIKATLSGSVGRDDVPFFSTNTGHLHKLKMQVVAPKQEHINVTKWRNELSGVPPDLEIWQHVWVPYRQEKINMFLWQVALRIPSTKHYVYTRCMADDQEAGEIVPRTDRRTWCERCTLQSHEDLLHLLWSCPESEKIWTWVREVLILTGRLKGNFSFTAAQALLGAKIDNAGRTFPYKLWEVIRGHAVWEIWVSRDRLHFDKHPVSFQEVVYSIWSMLRQYVRIDWMALEEKVDNKTLTLDDAQVSIKYNFGDCEQFFSVSSAGIRIEYSPIGIV
jgi:hypothetical protein